MSDSAEPLNEYLIELTRRLPEAEGAEKRRVGQRSNLGGRIEAGFLAEGWPGILAGFYFRIRPGAGADPEVWVITGDVPPAYIDTLECKTAREALEAYTERMREWVAQAKAGGSLEGFIPVYRRGAPTLVEPEPAIVEGLEGRMDFIREHFLQ